jgi:hypothetical protein
MEVAMPRDQSVTLFCAEQNIPYEPVVVDILTGAHHKEPFSKLNPSKQVVNITFPTNGNIKILAMDLVYQPALVKLAGNHNPVSLTSSTGTTPGTLGGAGRSDSLNALGGGTVSGGTNPFYLEAEGANDVVQATRQTIPLQPGKYSTLRLVKTLPTASNSGPSQSTRPTIPRAPSRSRSGHGSGTHRSPGKRL